MNDSPRIVDLTRFEACCRADAELLHALRGLTACIRLALGSEQIDLAVEAGVPSIGLPGGAKPDVVIRGPQAFWRAALVATPQPGFESLTSAAMHGVVVEGPFESIVAPYQRALQRLFVVLRECVAGPMLRLPVDPEPYRATDVAVGRYVFVRCGQSEARVYYEEAGNGPQVLVLQHTAGGDSRQYRHVLANPGLQRRFRMIAWDLPYHGRSPPPADAFWWQEHYRPNKRLLMDWTVAICNALALERPVFLGCSLGGQLALDLAAHHADRFSGFVALNGWYELKSRGRHDNEVHRRPTTSTDYFASRILAATSPQAPERSAHEVYWVYRSNMPGVYAGDNDYFMTGHDLREDGHQIDATRTPVYVVAGEYDPSALSPDHGGAAIASHVPGVEYRVLPGLGHFAPSDDPVRFCEAITPILDEMLAWVPPAGKQGGS